jgi:hypothetical protein
MMICPHSGTPRRMGISVVSVIQSPVITDPKGFGNLWVSD